jgi:hypothetical protein
MMRLILHLFDGLPLRFSRADLEELCQEKAMVILRLERSASEWK